MSDEKEVVVELTPEEVRAAQLDGFVEANSSTSTKAETAQAAEAVLTPEQEAEQKAAEEAEAKAAQDKADSEAQAAEAAKAALPVLAGYTESQVAELLEKAKQFDAVKGELSKVYGKFGSIEQTLKGLAEAKGSGVALTDEDVADLKNEYGPEMASAMLKVLNKFGSKLGKAAPAEHQAEAKAGVDELIAATRKEMEDKLTSTVEATQRAIELKMLNREHKDWRSIIRTPDDKGFNPAFVAWSATLPADEQDKLYNSWDAEFLSDKIGEYKNFVKAQEKPAATAKPQAKPVPNRLKTATVQQGVPGSVTPKSALDEQRDGYNSAL